MDKKMLRLLSIMSGAAVSIIFYVLSGIALGIFIDYNFEKIRPVATVILTFVGLILGFYKLYQVFKKTEQMKD